MNDQQKAEVFLENLGVFIMQNLDVEILNIDFNYGAYTVAFEKNNKEQKVEAVASEINDKNLYGIADVLIKKISEHISAAGQH